MKADIRICIPLIYTLISRIHLRDCEILLKRRLEGSGDFSDTGEASEGDSPQRPDAPPEDDDSCDGDQREECCSHVKAHSVLDGLLDGALHRLLHRILDSLAASLRTSYSVSYIC